MPRQIALLRGINLGARNRVSMPDLRELLTGLGHEDVKTLLQSGNVVLTSDETGEQLEQALEAAIARELGVESRVIVRSARELAAVVKRNPLADVADDPKRHQVSFLSAKPEAAVVRALEAADVAPEQVVVHGREIYAWHPGGIQRSPLVKLLTDRELGVTATARNWNTVTKLLELARE
ncbi:MAG: DUF1697 domain-containing protein [Solirubrobacteraceae bacterium]